MGFPHGRPAPPISADADADAEPDPNISGDRERRLDAPRPYTITLKVRVSEAPMSARAAHLSLASGRYVVYGEIASGGMATIHYGRLIGPSGFSRAVAIKQLHPQFAKDHNFVSMFLDEARLSARIAHANVVQTIDVLSEPSELSVIMEYVHGESLARLLECVAERRETIPVRIAAALVAGVLHGLHAAHETCGEHGEPLQIVHRDVSPENILVASDGIARLVDFGIARAQGRSRVTPAGELKGKLAYMAVEQYRGGEIDRRVDVYGAAVVLWEALTGRALFEGDTDAAVVFAVMNEEIIPPSVLVPAVTPALDAIVLRGLSRDRELRFASARDMALALEREVGLGTQSEVSDWLERVAGELLQARSLALRELRTRAGALEPPTPTTELAGTRRLEAPSLPADATISELDRPSPAQATRASELRRAPSKASGHKRWALGAGALLLVAAGGWWVARDARTRGAGHSVTLREPSRDPHDEAGLAPQPSVPANAPEATVPPAPATPALAPAPSFDKTKPAPLTPQPSEAARAAERERERRTSDDTPLARPKPSRGEPAEPAATAGEAARTSRSARGKDRMRETKKPAVDCREPFVTDARGIRHVRRECLD
jgi:eukaryotic-like serine/threonine-protein kinase